ncbi:hypothetical protein BN14_09736 [Rhizoctonia solani AG-1 IB]|uniref:Uncharacterized protein n=1 Tax=Thanatephorus cucumeris (strain AG1-IB / isolate 7/3/14) TaxID=1108050 RepID=M5C6R7_THACB|nr:hypothetical protein BN14_09736 [Rhizoctonia solani AG-1 IB]
MPFSRSRSRSHSCSRSTRVRVESLPNSSRAVSDAVHTTEPAEEPHIGLFDLPPDDPRSLEFVDGPRQSRPTKRKIQYQAGRGHDNRKRSRSLDTRARNRSLQRTQPNGPASQAVTDKESEQPNHSDTDDVRVPASRAGSLVTRPLARSSSPGATHNEFPGPRKPQVTPSTHMNTTQSIIKGSSSTRRRSSASTSANATPKRSSTSSGSPRQNRRLKWDLRDARLRSSCYRPHLSK